MPATITVAAILFDMDGTLVDSTPGVFAAWDIFARDYNLNAREVAHATHGRRLYDTLKEWCKIEDEDAEIIRFEEAVIQGGPVVLPGALELIEQIRSGSTKTAHGWTIVTSASNIYTPRALERCSIPTPTCGLVTSNDVAHGKPHPAPYLAGAGRCGVDPRECLVIEDAPSGLKAGRAAGSLTLGVCTSHSKDSILASGAEPDYIIKDLTYISARWVDGKILLTIRENEE